MDQRHDTRGLKGERMLLEILGVIVGFATVMLVVSLIVTALTQFAHTVLGFRSSSLRFALRALFERVLADDAGRMAKEVVASARFKPEAERPKVEAIMSVVVPDRQIRTPKLAELEKWIADAGIDLGPDQRAELGRHYDEAMRAFSDQFERWVKVVVVVLSFAAAFILQLSATDLVVRLSSDHLYRAAAVHLGEQLSDRDPSELLLRPRTYQEVSESALETLAERHPEDAALIEEASGVGRNADVIDELDTILRLENHPRRAALVEEYRTLLEGGLRSDLALASRQFREQYAHLAMLDLSPWREGWGFYAKWQSWLGVLLSTALLSLGAPFWYDTLRKSVYILRTTRDGAEREPIGNPQPKPVNGETGAESKG